MSTCLCGNEIDPRREAIGFFTCLSCGDKDARRVAEWRANSVIETHKSNMVFLGTDPVQARKTLLEITGMRRTRD